MFAALKRIVLAVARVPAEPHAPFGSPGSVRTFRAGAAYWSYLVVLWGLRQLASAVLAVVLLVGSGILAARVASATEITVTRHGARQTRPVDPAAMRWLALGIRGAGFVAVAFILAQAPLTLAAARLHYEMRWYIVTDRSLRVREGIFAVREMTLTFANVQNITIDQGPLQRLLGIADVVVRTAGGGGAAEAGGHAHPRSDRLHVGTLRAVDDAAGVRDLILDRLRRLKDAGLGDPDDGRRAGVPSADDASLADAARAFRDAAADLAVEIEALRR